ncbi:MAG: TetR/AcrR family transcriptional regulator [Acidimicrobiales bacterium]|nr:TetR/AcrR family transcriptional regulator [Acidimicrobiales bacterium]MCB9393432.1 TetR/AcrR family transcriptional regulator [Acidimicrobiaceae bacterium]
MNVRARRGPGRPAGGRLPVDREALLDAAERVIARDGPGASIESIAAEAGVTKPIVYARVGARADLCDALAARFADRLVSSARHRVVDLEPSRGALVGIVRATLETIGEHRSLFVFVSGGGDDLAERTLHLAGRSAPRLAALYATWRSSLGLPTTSAEPWAYATIGMLHLVAMWWLESGDESAEQLAQRLADLLWPGLSSNTYHE